MRSSSPDLLDRIRALPITLRFMFIQLMIDQTPDLSDLDISSDDPKIGHPFERLYLSIKFLTHHRDGSQDQEMTKRMASYDPNFWNLATNKIFGFSIYKDTKPDPVPGMYSLYHLMVLLRYLRQCFNTYHVGYPFDQMKNLEQTLNNCFDPIGTKKRLGKILELYGYPDYVIRHLIYDRTLKYYNLPYPTNGNSEQWHIRYNFTNQPGKYVVDEGKETESFRQKIIEQIEYCWIVMIHAEEYHKFITIEFWENSGLDSKEIRKKFLAKTPMPESWRKSGIPLYLGDNRKYLSKS